MSTDVVVGNRPRVYVTGTMHSGTAVVVALAKELGLDTGAEHMDMAWKPLWALSRQIGDSLGRGVEPVRGGWTDVLTENITAVADAAAPEMDKLDFPTVVGCADYGQSILLARIKPQVIVVTHRSLLATTRSVKQRNMPAFKSLTGTQIWNGLAQSFGVLMANVLTSDIPYVLLDIERGVGSEHYMYERLGSYLEPDKRRFGVAYKLVVKEALALCGQ